MSEAANGFDVAAYWFGNWHVDPRMEGWYGPGWTEWELVKTAKPRFSGHYQPIVPQWGYTDDADPADLVRASSAAASAGIDAFLIDWYWYDGPMLNRPIDEAFDQPDLPIDHAVMWANHTWTNVFPGPRGAEPQFLASARVDLSGFRHITQLVMERYMTRPRYWRVGGAAYFSIFELDSLIEWLGGVDETARALDDFRHRAEQAGVGELHLATVSTRLTPNGHGVRNLATLGIDSVNHYNWSGQLPDRPLIEYSDWRAIAEREWDESAATWGVPSAANVSVGWDASPRTEPDAPLTTDDWPYGPVVVGNSPEQFEAGLRNAAAWTRAHPEAGYLTINAWNEWTEGSYLEPDELNGTARLDAVARVFGG